MAKHEYKERFTPPFIALYHCLVTPDEGDNGNEYCSVDALFPHPDRVNESGVFPKAVDPEKYATQLKAFIKDIKAEAAELVEAEWGDKLPRGLTENPIRRGDDPTFARYPCVEDKDFIIRLKANISAKFSAPPCVGPLKGSDDKFPQLEESDVYSGCTMRAKMNLYVANPQDKKLARGVFAGLKMSQKMYDGERIAMGAANPNEFEEVDIDDLDELDEQVDTSVDDLDDAFDA